MGGLLRPEIGLCAEIDLVLRAATYGDVLYIDQPLMDFTVREDGDSHSRGFSERAWNRPLSPLGVALVSALRVHLDRRDVSRQERAAVYSVVAQTQIQRAFQHRYRHGGRGRRGALLDVMRAIGWSPGTVLRPNNLAYALAAILSPKALIVRARKIMLKRSYRDDFETGGDGDALAGWPAANGADPVPQRKPRVSQRWNSVVASVASWFSPH